MEPVLEDEALRGSSQVEALYNRARASGTELLRLFSTLATGAVGVFFLALSGRVEPPLTAPQRGAIIVALLLMVLTLAGAILSRFADALFYKSWARYASGKDPERNLRRRELAIRLRETFAFATVIVFFAGVLVAAYYVYLRLPQP